MSADLEAARAAKAALAEHLRGAPSVTGIGIARTGAGGFCVRVLLRRATPELTLPPDVDGVPVESEVVGEIRALDHGTRTTRGGPHARPTGDGQPSSG